MRLPHRPGLTLASLFNRRATPFVVALGVTAVFILFALFAGQGRAEQALLLARWTARPAALLFLVPFLARPLAKLWPSAFTRALLVRRRQWGLAFALVLAIHLVALLHNILFYAPRSPASLIPGAIAYLFVFAMAFTSTNAAQRRMGKNWKRLHLIGLWIIWAVFIVSYGSRLFRDDPSYQLTGLIFSLLFILAFALRFWASNRHRAHAT